MYFIPFDVSFTRLRAGFAAGVSVIALSVSAGLAQSPQDGVVVQGSATIAQTARQSTISQSSERAIIDWSGFDVGKDHRVLFDQPGRSSATLNRVQTVRPSVIEGAITAPGTVVIQNTAGVLFTGTARVDVGGLVATSQRVDADYFQQSGNYRIGGGERIGASVVNRGEFTIGEAGLAALVGRHVENSGSIIAPLGTIALASGERTTIDMTGDGMFQIAVEGDAPGGGVKHSGTLDASGGTVILTAGGAAGALDSVINTSGLIRATSVSGKGGTVRLSGRDAGLVRVAGKVEAGGATDGGDIFVTGETVHLTDTADLDASGLLNGGRILLGGEYKGLGDMRRASDTILEYGAQVRADGGSETGGTVIAWADGTTVFDGSISATGGVAGGFVETSGKMNLGVGPNAGVALGAGGQWLLDPRNVFIEKDFAGGSLLRPYTQIPASGGVIDPPGVLSLPWYLRFLNYTGAPDYQPGYGYLIDGASIETALNGGSDVTITTNSTDAYTNSLGMAGDIHVWDPIQWTGTGNLVLDADNDIFIKSYEDTPVADFISSTAPGKSGDFTARAGRNLIVHEDIRAGNSASIELTAETGNLLIGNTESNRGVNIKTWAGSMDLNAPEGSVLIGKQGGVSSGYVDIWAGGGGDINVTAGKDIDLTAGTGQAQRVRLGLGNAGPGGLGSAVSMKAENIKVIGGRPLSSYAQIVTDRGGSITLEASQSIEVANGARGVGKIQAFDETPLTMNAPKQTWNGLVAAGSGSDDGGDVVLGGHIFATEKPLFSLASGKTFDLAMGAIGGSFTSRGIPLEVSTSGLGATGGIINIGGGISAPQVTFESEQGVILHAGGRVAGTGDGDAVVISAGEFFGNYNTASAVQVTNPNARWLIYVNRLANFDPVDNTEPGPHEANLYGRTYAGNPPDDIANYPGNRIIYAEQPTLTFAGDILTKTYGEEVTAGYTMTGLRPGDDIETALDGAPTVDSPGDPATATVDGSPYPVNIVTTASDQGYLVEIIPGSVTIDPALLTIVASEAAKSQGETLSFAGTEFTATGLLNTDTVDSVSLASDGAVATAPVDGSPYAITASSAVGVGLGNYDITYEPGLLFVFPSMPGGGDGGGGTDGGSGGGAVGPIAGGGGTSPVAGPVDANGFITGQQVGAALGTARRFTRGVNPLTPGDATFRTTELDAPLASSDPFALTYSLGEVAQTGPVAAAAPGADGFVPAAGGLADAEGFVPAAGGLADGETACGFGLINVGVPDAPDCVRLTVTESYWTTRAGELQ